MWAEEFRFFTPCLPALVSVRTYDWDIISKNAELGAASLLVEGEALPFTAWYPLDKGLGQVCLQLQVTAVPRNKADSTAAKGAAISSSRLRRLSQQPTGAGAGEKQEGEVIEGERPEQQQEQEAGRGTEVRLKPGPLQTIFGLPPDEVIRHSFSCALERSFLYHGRMFLSGAHLCFHSNVFSKELTVCIPYQDIEEVRRSTHALINPAMTVVLHLGTGGHGVPPLPSPDGRVKYKFASFWNRGHAMRLLQEAIAEFWKMEEAAALEEEQDRLRAISMRDGAVEGLSFRGAASEAKEEEKEKQPFLDLTVLEHLLQFEVPCTAETYFNLLYSDSSDFVVVYRAKRKDTELKVGEWKETEQYGGKLREVTYRSLCDSPMCPPSTAMTEWQHTAFSAPDHKHLVLELINQAHDVPFGSYFEVHAQWTVKTTSDNPESPSCSAELKAGVHFKKWCMMQGKIRQGAQAEMKRNSQAMMEMAMTYIAERTQSGNQAADCNANAAAGSGGGDSGDSNGRGNGGDVKVEGGEAGGLEGRDRLVEVRASRCYLREVVKPGGMLVEKGHLGLSRQDLVLRRLKPKGHLGLSRQDLTRFTTTSIPLLLFFKTPPLPPPPFPPDDSMPHIFGEVASRPVPSRPRSFHRPPYDSAAPSLPSCFAPSLRPSSDSMPHIIGEGTAGVEGVGFPVSPSLPHPSALLSWCAYSTTARRPFGCRQTGVEFPPSSPLSPLAPPPCSPGARTAQLHTGLFGRRQMVQAFRPQQADGQPGGFRVSGLCPASLVLKIPSSPLAPFTRPLPLPPRHGSSGPHANALHRSAGLHPASPARTTKLTFHTHSNHSKPLLLSPHRHGPSGPHAHPLHRSAGLHPASPALPQVHGADERAAGRRGSGNGGGSVGGARPGVPAPTGEAVDSNPSVPPFPFLPLSPLPTHHSPGRGSGGGCFRARVRAQQQQLHQTHAPSVRHARFPFPPSSGRGKAVLEHGCLSLHQSCSDHTALPLMPHLRFTTHPFPFPFQHDSPGRGSGGGSSGARPPAEAVVEALLEHGRLSLHQLVQRSVAKAGSSDPSAAKTEGQVRQQLVAALSVLIHERLVERVGAPEPMLLARGATSGGDAPKPASRARVRKRAMMESSGYFDSEEHRVVVAATLGAVMARTRAMMESSGYFDSEGHRVVVAAPLTRCPLTPLSPLSHSPSAHTAMMESSGYFDSEEHRVVVAARCSDALRFQLPGSWVLSGGDGAGAGSAAIGAGAAVDGSAGADAGMSAAAAAKLKRKRVVLDDDDEEEQAGPSAKRPATGAAAVGGSAGGGEKQVFSRDNVMPLFPVFSSSLTCRGNEWLWMTMMRRRSKQGPSGKLWPHHHTVFLVSALAPHPTALHLQRKRVVMDDDDEEEQAGPSAKRPATGAAAAVGGSAGGGEKQGGGEDSGVLWRVNYEEFLRRTRHQENETPGGVRVGREECTRWALGWAANKIPGVKQGGGGEDSGVLWRVNYEEFLRRTRHQTIVDFVRESIDPGASIIDAALFTTPISATLHLSSPLFTPLHRSPPDHTSLSLDSIVNAVRGTEDGRTMALDRIRAALQLLVAHPSAVASRASDAHYTIRGSNSVSAFWAFCLPTVPPAAVQELPGAEAGEGGRAIRGEAGERGGAIRGEAGEGGGAIRAEAGEGGRAIRAEAGEGGRAIRAEAGEGGRAIRAEAGEGGRAIRGEAGERGGAIRGCCIGDTLPSSSGHAAGGMSADARQLLYRMMLDEFVQLQLITPLRGPSTSGASTHNPLYPCALSAPCVHSPADQPPLSLSQEVPKTADHAPQRTFYLWRIHIATVLPRVLNHMCHRPSTSGHPQSDGSAARAQPHVPPFPLFGCPVFLFPQKSPKRLITPLRGPSISGASTSQPHVPPFPLFGCPVLLFPQEVPKTADHAPQRTFYLWRIHIATVLPRVLNHMCHGACNLRLRLEHEMQQEQEIEQAHAAHSTGGAGSSAGGEARAAPEKAVALTSGQRKQLERIRRVLSLLEQIEQAHAAHGASSAGGAAGEVRAAPEKAVALTSGQRKQLERIRRVLLIYVLSLLEQIEQAHAAHSTGGASSAGGEVRPAPEKAVALTSGQRKQLERIRRVLLIYVLSLLEQIEQAHAAHSTGGASSAGGEVRAAPEKAVALTSGQRKQLERIRQALLSHPCIEQAHAAHSAGSTGGAAGGEVRAAPEKAVALTSGQRKQLERIRRVAAVLETSLLRLDDTITLFSAF
ncbi:unnamed protein product [Closterium sp. Naga37s-1]|nr:unnamed protein product [Closterium sp. Naga37s-1]